jgi:hypothetical protein
MLQVNRPATCQGMQVFWTVDIRLLLHAILLPADSGQVACVRPQLSVLTSESGSAQTPAVAELLLSVHGLQGTWKQT